MFTCLVWLVAASVLARATPRRALHQYVFFNLDRSRLDSPEFVSTAALEGAQVKYPWKQLEPTRDRYDFSRIRTDLATLSKHGKRLFIQIQDASFEAAVNPVPAYLTASKTWADDEVHQEGWVSRRWDPSVQARFASLLQALGREFDGKIEGITLPETAVGFGDSGRRYPAGFTPARYAECVVQNMAAAKQAFPHSVCLQYANFMPGEWLPDNDHGYLRQVYAAAHRLHVAVGGPDVLPDKPGQMHNSYSFLHALGPDDIVGMAVQEGNYDYAGRKSPAVPRLLAFARDYLHADYLFWCTEEPFYSKQLIPALQASATP